jgi:hypothetical protein
MNSYQKGVDKASSGDNINFLRRMVMAYAASAI